MPTKTKPKQWAQDHDAFKELLTKGKLVELAIAGDLILDGFTVTLGGIDPRDNAPRHADFDDHFDLRVHVGSDITGIEVKSRSIEFTGPHDFPYDTAFVSRTGAWDRREDKPFAVVLVSQPTGGRVVAPAADSDQWEKHHFWDRVRRIKTDAYAAPVATLRDWDWLITELKEMQ